MPLPAVAPAIRRNVFFGIGRACVVARHNTEAVYVAADTAAECEEHAAALTTLAIRHGLTMLKLNNLLHASALSHIDTSPVDLETRTIHLPHGAGRTRGRPCA
jgi:hypothetical protein